MNNITIEASNEYDDKFQWMKVTDNEYSVTVEIINREDLENPISSKIVMTKPFSKKLMLALQKIHF